MKKRLFSKNEDYTSQMNSIINELFDAVKVDGLPSHEERNMTVNEIIEAYVDETGERPKNGHLERLSTYILKEERYGADWKDDGEYPVLSNRQYKSRTDRERSLPVDDVLDTYGVNQTVNTRQSRIEREIRGRKIK